MAEAVFDFADIRARMLGDLKPRREVPECETCGDTGLVDESLGGTPRSGIVKCPDCAGVLWP